MMNEDMFEALLYLKMNRRHWTIRDVVMEDMERVEEERENRKDDDNDGKE